MHLLPMLLELIITQYFRTPQCIAFISDINLIPSSINLPIVSLTNETVYLESTLLKVLDLGCEYFVIKDPELNFFDEFRTNVQISEQRKGNRKLIFICDNEIEVLALMKMNEFIRDFPDFIVIQPEVTSYDFFNISNDFESYKILTRLIYDENKIVVLDRWFSTNLSFVNGINLFPDKLWDLMGMVLKITTIDYPPYDIVRDCVDVFPYQELNCTAEGLEFQLIREYANRHNASLKFTLEPDLWGEIYPNRTGYGLFGSLVQLESDIGLGAIATWSNIRPYMEQSHIYIRAGVSCLVPVPRLLNKFNVPILPFTPSLWIVVGISTITLTLMFTCISHLSITLPSRPELSYKVWTNFGQSAYIIYGMMLLQPLPESAEHKNGSFRNLLTWILLQTLLISTAYSSGLSAVMTLPRYETAIKTVEELIASGMEWGALDDAWIYSILGTDQPGILTLIKNFRAYDHDKLKRIAPQRKFAYSIERLSGGSFAVGDYIDENNVMGLQTMNEDIYWANVAAMFRKSSPFLPYFDDMIMHLKEGGLILAMETRVALKSLNFLIQQRVRLSVPRGNKEYGGTDSNDDPVILRISDLQGVFTFWGVGMIISCFCFVFEIIPFPKKHPIFS